MIKVTPAFKVRKAKKVIREKRVIRKKETGAIRVRRVNRDPQARREREAYPALRETRVLKDRQDCKVK